MVTFITTLGILGLTEPLLQDEEKYTINADINIAIILFVLIA